MELANMLLILGLMVLIQFLVHQAAKQGVRLYRLERKVDSLLKKFDVDPNADADPEVLAMARSGRKIDAIKKYREDTGASLKDAKDYVDQLTAIIMPP